MNDFIGKPVEPELLYAALLRWLPLPEDAQSANQPATKQAATRAASPAPNSTTEADLARLAAVPGMAVTRSLALLSGNADKYLALFGRFIESHADDMALLTTALAAGEFETARRVAHTLKGTAATMGADHLAQLAEQLDAILRTSPQGSVSINAIRPEMDAINLELTLLAAALPRLPAVTPPAASTPTDPATLRSIIEKLDTLLAQGDTAAIPLFDQHAGALHAALGERTEPLARQIRQFDFENALTTLRSRPPKPSDRAV